VGVRLRPFERALDRELEDGQKRQRSLHERNAVPTFVAEQLALARASEDPFGHDAIL
jgi:hypothetical protein